MEQDASAGVVRRQSEPVPATWFRGAVFGIRRPTRWHKGALKGALVAFLIIRRSPFCDRPPSRAYELHPRS